jgi:hypothetical protein
LKAKSDEEQFRPKRQLASASSPVLRAALVKKSVGASEWLCCSHPKDQSTWLVGRSALPHYAPRAREKEIEPTYNIICQANRAMFSQRSCCAPRSATGRISPGRKAAQANDANSGRPAGAGRLKFTGNKSGRGTHAGSGQTKRLKKEIVLKRTMWILG